MFVRVAAGKHVGLDGADNRRQTRQQIRLVPLFGDAPQKRRRLAAYIVNRKAWYADE